MTKGDTVSVTRGVTRDGCGGVTEHGDEARYGGRLRLRYGFGYRIYVIHRILYDFYISYGKGEGEIVKVAEISLDNNQTKNY